MSITIKGLERLKASVAKLDEIKQAFADEFIKRVMEKTPVDTGRLASSWEYMIEGTQIKITNPARNDRGEPYVIYVEFGTEHIPGHFMLNRTVAEAPDILRVARQKVGL